MAFNDIFSNLLIVAVHYTYQINLCIFSIVDCTHIHHIVHYKINHILLFLLPAYMKGKQQPPSRIW